MTGERGVSLHIRGENPHCEGSGAAEPHELAGELQVDVGVGGEDQRVREGIAVTHELIQPPPAQQNSSGREEPVERRVDHDATTGGRRMSYTVSRRARAGELSIRLTSS